MQSGGILALDVARRTGWAYVTQAGIKRWPEHSTLGLPLSEMAYGARELGPAAMEHGQLYQRFRSFLAPKLTDLEPALLIVEAPIVANTGGREQLRRSIGLISMADEMAAARGLLIREAAIASWKKQFVGSGRASKEDVFDQCTRQGAEPQTQDAADAIGILSFGVSIWQAWTEPRRAA